MKGEDFVAAVATTQMRRVTIDAARRVLVDGQSIRTAADAVGRTYETVRAAVARVNRAHRELLGCPNGWEVVTVALPPEDALDVRELERRRKEAHPRQQD